MVDQTMCKKMTAFQKMAWDNFFTAMDKMHEQGESVSIGFLNQAAWLPEENKIMFKEWSKGCKTVRAQFKVMIDDGFKSIEGWSESFTDSAGSPARKTTEASTQTKG